MSKSIVVPYDVKVSIFNDYHQIKELLKSSECGEFKINLSSLLADAVKGKLYTHIIIDHELDDLKKRGRDFKKTSISLSIDIFNELEKFSKEYKISKRILLQYCAKKVIETLKKNITALKAAIVGQNNTTNEIYISIMKLKKLHDNDLISERCRKMLGQISNVLELKNDMIVFGEKKMIIKLMLECLKKIWSKNA